MIVTVVGEVDMRVLYVDATKVKALLNKYADPTLKDMEFRIEAETGRVNLNFKSARKEKNKCSRPT